MPAMACVGEVGNPPAPNLTWWCLTSPQGVCENRELLCMGFLMHICVYLWLMIAGGEMNADAVEGDVCRFES